MWFNDFLRALADVIRAAAWPAVVIFLLYRYRDRLGELIPRLRELFGAKFDPPPEQQTHQDHSNPVERLQSLAPDDPTVGAPPAVVAVPGALPHVIAVTRTPAVIEAEQVILNTVEMRGLVDPHTREQALSTIAAAMLVLANFAQVEADIWASQLYLLQALNSAPTGIPREQVKTNYYDVAAVRFPVWFANYSFDGYMAFLSSFKLVVDAPTVTISEWGREYLIWRLRARKPMKVAG